MKVYFAEAFHGLALVLRRPVSAFVWIAGASAAVGLVNAATGGVGPAEENMIVEFAAAAATVFTATAVMRSVLRPGQGGLFFMRAGADELLQVAVLVAVGAAYSISLMAAGAALAVMGLSAASQGVALEPMAGGAIAVLAVTALLVVALLSLIPPMSFDRKALKFGGGAAMALKRFFSLLPVFVVMAAAQPGLGLLLDFQPGLFPTAEIVRTLTDWAPALAGRPEVDAFVEGFGFGLPGFATTVVSFGAAAAAYRSIKAVEAEPDGG